MKKISVDAIEIGTPVSLLPPFRPGTARLVSIIKAGTKPDSNDILKWYGENAPRSVFGSFDFDRLVFQREDSDSHIIFPDTDTKTLFKFIKVMS